MLRNIALKGSAQSVRRARLLRRNMSLPEVLLWQALRGSPNGLKFRPQHPTGPYDLDFYCSDARLAIEVDGEAHERGNRPTRDAARDRWLRDRNVETMRIPAVQILKDLEGAVRGIVAEATARLPLHHPAVPGGPPPRHKLGLPTAGQPAPPPADGWSPSPSKLVPSAAVQPAPPPADGWSPSPSKLGED
jgi:very-short-patch-repair endonuclease